MKKHKRANLNPYQSLDNQYSSLQRRLERCDTPAELARIKEAYEKIKKDPIPADLTHNQSVRISSLQSKIDELISEKDQEFSSELPETGLSEPAQGSILNMLSNLAFFAGNSLKHVLVDGLDPTQVNEDLIINKEYETSSESAKSPQTKIDEEPFTVEKGELTRVKFQQQLVDEEEEDDTLYESPTSLKNEALPIATRKQDEEIGREHSEKLGFSFDKLKQHHFKKSQAQLLQKAQSIELISLKQEQSSLTKAHSFPKMGVDEEQFVDSERLIEEEDDTLDESQAQLLQKAQSVELIYLKQEQSSLTKAHSFPKMGVDEEPFKAEKGGATRVELQQQLVDEEEQDDALYESPRGLQNEVLPIATRKQDEEIGREHSEKLGSSFDKLKQHPPKKPHSHLSQQSKSVELISLTLDEQQLSQMKAKSLPHLDFQFDAHKVEKVTKVKPTDDESLKESRKQHLEKVRVKLEIIAAKHEKFKEEHKKYFKNNQFECAEKYSIAADAAKNIHNQIVTLSKKYYEDGDLDSYKSASKKVLDEDNPNVKTLQEHRGWKLILTNLAALIFTAGLAHVGYSLYNGRFSLFEPATDSTKKVEALRESVDTVTLTV